MATGTVVRARNVQRTAVATAAVLGVGLVVVTLVRTDNVVARVAGMVIFLAVWAVLSRFFTKVPKLELRVVSAEELPPIEPVSRTTAKVVGLHLVVAVVFLALQLIPWNGASAIPAVFMLGMVIVYVRSDRRIARVERERGGAIWTTSTYAWTSSQAKAQIAYLVPSAGSISSEPDVAGRA